MARPICPEPSHRRLGRAQMCPFLAMVVLVRSYGQSTKPLGIGVREALKVPFQTDHAGSIPVARSTC